MRRFITLVVATAFVTLTAGALEVDQGDLRLVLDESSSRFSLYQKVNANWVPLFVAEDPRTSGLDILENNNVYRMGEGGSFSQRAERTAQGARYVWSSATLEVIQAFAFTRGFRSQRTDALAMTVSITNVGEEPATVGVRLLFDTYLGERSNTHFVTPGSDQITKESQLTPGPVNRYVASKDGPNATYGFQFMLQADAITQPTSVVVANWKRLTDSTWDYTVNPTRNFNRLPYSINDSALLVTYGPAQLVSGDSYSVIAQFGALSDGGYLSPEVASQGGSGEPSLSRLADLLTEINALMDSESIDPQEVARLKAELETLSRQVSRR